MTTIGIVNTYEVYCVRKIIEDKIYKINSLTNKKSELLPNTKVSKNIAQQIIIGNFTCYFSKVI